MEWNISPEQLLADLYEKTGVSVKTSSDEAHPHAFSANVHGRELELFLGGEKRDEEKISLIRYLLENTDQATLPGKEESLKNILLGEGTGWYVYKFMSRYNVGDEPCYAVSVEEGKRMNETFAHILGCASDSKDLVIRMDDSHCAIVRFAGDGQTPSEFTSFLSQSLYEEVGVKASVGVGGEVSSFSEIAQSYLQAVTAVRMSGIFHSKGEVHFYREYLLVKMLEDVPESKLREYLSQFSIDTDCELFEDEEMLDTAEEFLESSLNISETSRNLFMHRNTLMYRLDKIERATGLNIRKFSDAVSFRIITILYKLMQ